MFGTTIWAIGCCKMRLGILKRQCFFSPKSMAWFFEAGRHNDSNGSTLIKWHSSFWLEIINQNVSKYNQKEMFFFLINIYTRAKSSFPTKDLCFFTKILIAVSLAAPWVKLSVWTVHIGKLWSIRIMIITTLLINRDYNSGYSLIKSFRGIL